MNAREPRQSLKQAKLIFACLLFSLLLAKEAQPLMARAESLFRASTTYSSAQEPVRARSLFTPPIAREVGDFVTININEVTQQTTGAELKVTRTQTIDENGSSLFKNTLNFVLNQLPFVNTTGLQNRVTQAPTLNGLDNSNNLSSKAELKRSTSTTDTIACQVVQVLPNGDLMVQGQKTIQANKERSDLIVTGIVRPYYLNSNNQIDSNMVANFQMIQGGKGVISRQQNDGLANKVYQFFN